MRTQNFILATSCALVILANLISCASKPTTVERIVHPSGIVKLDNNNFANEVKSYRGPVLVLFYNQEYWQSRDMEKRFDYFAKKFDTDAKFCKFHWDINDDAEPYDLELLPTVVLYKNGAEFDRIRGINPDEKERANLNDDMELWIMKNALEMQGSKYNAEYKYLFNNSFTLHVTN